MCCPFKPKIVPAKPTQEIAKWKGALGYSELFHLAGCRQTIKSNKYNVSTQGATIFEPGLAHHLTAALGFADAERSLANAASGT